MILAKNDGFLPETAIRIYSNDFLQIGLLSEQLRNTETLNNF